MEATKKLVDLTRIKNDINGNPRYVFHFLTLINKGDDILADTRRGDVFGIHTKYNIALNKARTIGGRKYHNKTFGGGIVCQMYNTPEERAQIMDLVTIKESDFLKEWTDKQFKKVERAIQRLITEQRFMWMPDHKQPRRELSYMNYKSIDSLLGLAYTSSGAYAGLWACNAGYLWVSETHRISGFAINTRGNVVVITEDDEEQTIFIELFY